MVCMCLQPPLPAIDYLQDFFNSSAFSARYYAASTGLYSASTTFCSRGQVATFQAFRSPSVNLTTAPINLLPSAGGYPAVIQFMFNPLCGTSAAQTNAIDLSYRRQSDRTFSLVRSFCFLSSLCRNTGVMPTHYGTGSGTPYVWVTIKVPSALLQNSVTFSLTQTYTSTNKRWAIDNLYIGKAVLSACSQACDGNLCF